MAEWLSTSDNVRFHSGRQLDLSVSSLSNAKWFCKQTNLNWTAMLQSRIAVNLNYEWIPALESLATAPKKSFHLVSSLCTWQ